MVAYFIFYSKNKIFEAKPIESVSFDTVADLTRTEIFPEIAESFSVIVFLMKSYFIRSALHEIQNK